MEVMMAATATATEDLLGDGSVLSPSRLGCQSPRISFCCDRAGAVSAASGEPLKSEETLNDFSTEFEFCMLQNVADAANFGHSMSSADELFLDGKLLPLHSCHETSMSRSCSEDPLVVDQQEEEEIVSPSSKEEDTSDSALLPHSSAVVPVTETGNILPKEFGEAHIMAESSVKSPKTSRRWKEIFKIGKSHVPAPEDCLEESKVMADKKAGGGGGGLNLNLNHAFALKQPLSPRSIWPFSRTSSAGDGKTSKSASCSLASSRSNSAGDSSHSSNQQPKSRSAPCSRSNSGSDSKSKLRPPFSARIHMDFISKSARNSSVSPSSSSSYPSEPDDPGTVPVAQEHPQQLHEPGESEPNTVPASPKLGPSENRIAASSSSPKANKKSAKKSAQDATSGSTRMLNNYKAGCSSSPGRGMKLRSPSRNYGRGSPVRIMAARSSGGCTGSSSPSARASGSGKFVNLERCSANPKTKVNSQDAIVWPCRLKEASSSKLSDSRPNSSYSNGVRVLNVPVCIGHSRTGRASSNNKLFSLKGFFSRRTN